MFHRYPLRPRPYDLHGVQERSTSPSLKRNVASEHGVIMLASKHIWPNKLVVYSMIVISRRQGWEISY